MLEGRIREGRVNSLNKKVCLLPKECHPVEFSPYVFYTWRTFPIYMYPNRILFLVVGIILLFSGCTVGDSLSSLQGGNAPAPASSEPPSSNANDSSSLPPVATDNDNNPLSQTDSPPSAPTPNTNTPSANDPSATASAPITGDLDGLTPNAETSLIFQALDEAGIRDAAVEFQTDNVLIAFNLPAGMTSEDAAYFAIGAASQFAQPAQFIWVQVFESASSKTYSVKADFVQKYSRGQLNANQLQAAITVTS